MLPRSLEKLFDLSGKKIVVTGASGQLGRAFSEQLKAMGAFVIGMDQTTPATSETDGAFFLVNLAKKAEIFKAFQTIGEKYGPIDGLINNAGVAVFSPFEDRTDEELDFVFDVNIRGVIHCIRAFISISDIPENSTVSKSCRSIVNIGSIYGVISPDFRIYTDCNRKSSEIYGATKAGVVQLTRYFSAHLAERGIRVNSICPGGILNENSPQGQNFQENYAQRCPMKRMGMAHEVAGAAVYFLSDSSSYTTGSNLMIDGGMSCW